MSVTGKLLGVLLCVAGLSCTRNTDRESAASVAGDCVRAMAQDDRAALHEFMTAQMYTDYVNAKAQMERAQMLLASFGKKPPDPSELELVSASCDRVDGNKAYVKVETRHGEKTSFETIVLKKDSGRWRVAGKEE